MKFEIGIGYIFLFCYLLITISLSLMAFYKNKKLYLFVKPLPIIGLFFFLLVNFIIDPNPIYLIILLALLFSVAGDIFIVLENKFVFGLASFLLCHILYIFYFYMRKIEYSYMTIIITLIFAALFFVFLILKRNNNLKNSMIIPVIIYVLVLSIMLISAVSFDIGRYKHLYLFSIGAILFFISDASLSIDKFVYNYKFTYIIVLLTYYLSQTFIMIGVLQK